MVWRMVSTVMKPVRACFGTIAATVLPAVGAAIAFLAPVITAVANAITGFIQNNQGLSVALLAVAGLEVGIRAADQAYAQGYRCLVMGEVGIELLNPKNVLLDPTAEDYDPKKWMDVITTKWYSLVEIERTWGKSAAFSPA